jgi:hypothetical protein
LIVIGPDVLYAVLGLAIVDTLGYGFVSMASKVGENNILVAGLVLLIALNLSWILITLMSPGLPPRNPNSHSKSYLNRVRTVE